METIPTRLPNIHIHPGEVLREDFLTPLGLSTYRLSKEIGVAQTQIGPILRGRRSVTAAQYWLLLQQLYDLEEERTRLAGELPRITPLASLDAATGGARFRGANRVDFLDRLILEGTVLEALGYQVLHGPDIAAGEPGAERSDPNYRDVLLEGHGCARRWWPPTALRRGGRVDG